ncbi:hypothetical protein LUZ61_016825 [Rhynchospora tenuis]|uniref:AAA+ ATPase domain-containing protein n=1 Tax=Rhynchospora tenuis TaxID=198213 RepID=A0AAD6EKE0_9POAL|nr:hypothetical protein LUZ61_016825 [Rhynchospora tenuis]
MAELVVDFALRKLGEMIVKEAELLGGVGDQVKGVETELRRIQCCLRDADSKRRNGDERVQNWLNELRDVAYRIEDTTDTFYLELEVNRHKDPSFWHQFKTLFRNPVKVPVLHQLTKELGKIQKELEGIFRSKDQYDIKFLQEEDRGEAVILPKRRAAYHEVDETEVVGLDVDKNNVLKLLSYEETPRRAVITIVGPGGLGKTTLARMVYKSAREDFQYHIMLSVSKQFNLTDLLRKMLKYSEPRNQDVGELMSELNSLLSKQRYLIILDDVWKDSNVWDQLQDAFPDHNNGSRVLITTREVEVAKSADPNMAPYKPDLLSDDNSRDLLLRKALPHP